LPGGKKKGETIPDYSLVKTEWKRGSTRPILTRKKLYGREALFDYGVRVARKKEREREERRCPPPLPFSGGQGGEEKLVTRP